MKIDDFQNKKIAILGFGLEGQSTLKFLQKQGIEDITILDKNNIIEDVGCKVVTGNMYLESLWDFDIIIKSPGVSPFWEKLLPHRHKFISGTQIFFENYSGKIIGITGTKGKSTISTLLFSFLQAAGYKVKLVGNIGTPVLDEIDVTSGETFDYVVYEMSSYMLQDFIPKLFIAYLNNIYPCHLDWHYDSMNIYKQAKLNILKNAKFKVVNSELQNDTEVLEVSWEKKYFNEIGNFQYRDRNIYYNGEKFYESSSIVLQGEHNYKNISGVLTIMDVVLRDVHKLKEIAQSILPTFRWLPHRIENIWVYEGVTFINDAIATTPESTIAAMNTFWSDLQTLFLGGEDSGFDFTKLRTLLMESSVQNIIAFPNTSEKVFPEIILRDYESPFELEIEWRVFQIVKTRSMKTWVDFAYKTTLPWKTALLSCAAPSFSLWNNYKEKAAEFIKEVQEY